MAESFLLLLAAGVMLATAVPNPKDVTLNWLRLGGILSLALAALGIYFASRTKPWHPDLSQWWPYVIFGALVLAHLALVQLARSGAARWLAVLAFCAGVYCCGDDVPLPKNFPGIIPPGTATAIGVAATTGAVLLAMLLGHAYLTASRMTIAPFRRLSAWLIGVMVVRALCAVGYVLWVHSRTPTPGFWPIHGFLIITRWTVGLVIPFIFILMAHDCIKRRSTQSATGILYVAGVLIFIGELLALHLARETGLPF